MDSRLIAFKRLLDIMDELRAKCPWDKKQTIESLRHLTIEETYELAEAISNNDLVEIKKELGDIMLHVVFYSKIASETNDFTITEVLNGICEKLIFRHPHIYGDVIVKDAEDVKANWEKIKMKEGRTSVLEGVPTALPSLIKAMRIQEKARGAGFDWDNSLQVWDKVNEELNELKEEVENDSPLERKTDELGDVLFALINYARFIKVNPEDALEHTNKKFISRFTTMEKSVSKQGKTLSEMTLPEMECFWEEAKQREM